MRLAPAIVGLALVGCAGEIDLEGRTCAEGEEPCLDGYTCHPGRQECVCDIEVGCDGAGSCPQLTQTNDPCPCPGAYLTCAPGAVGCEYGCRDCRADGTWSPCSEEPCDSRAPELCDDRDNDCDGRVDNGIYGCDCTAGSAGNEVCDGRDNDCNTAIDDGFPCRFDSARACDGGQGVESCNPDTCQWSGTCVPRDSSPPGPVTGFVAVPENGRVQLSWVHPPDPDLYMCVVRRKRVDIPNHHLLGDLIHVELPATPSFARNVRNDGLTNGQRYAYAVFCRDEAGSWNDSVQIGVNAGDAIPTAGAAVNPTDFDASDGEDTQSTITFTLPAESTECRLRRKRNDSATDYPGGHEEVDSTLLFTITSMAQLPYVDSGLTNGASYYYAVFCSNGEVWNDDVVIGGNADVGQPRDPVPDNPNDFDASDGEDSLSTLTFTMPATEECKVLRRDDGAYPGNETDGNEVANFTTPGPVEVVDTGLTNGVTYHYAVFCREGTTWNRDRFDAANADTASPVDIAISNEDLVVRGTRDGNAVVSDAVTFVDNQLYLAVVTTRPYLTASSVTGLGFTWQQASAQCGADNVTGTEIWWAFGSPSGSNQVRATFASNADGALLSVLRYAGVNSAVSIGSTTSTNTGGGACNTAASSTVWSSSLSTTAGSLVLGAVAILAAGHTPSGVSELDESHANSGSNEVGTALIEASGTGASVFAGGALTTSEKWAVCLVELMP